MTASDPLKLFRRQEWRLEKLAAGAAAVRALRRPSLRVLVAVGFFILALTSAASIWLVWLDRWNSDLAAHTAEVENQLSDLQLFIRRAESMQRGYLLTSESEYLRLLHVDREKVGPAIERLKGLFDSDRKRQQQLTTLEQVVVRRLMALDEAIRRHEQGDAAGVRDLVRHAGEQEMGESIRTLIENMKLAERQALTQSDTEERRASNFLLAATLVGAALIVLLAGVSINEVRRNMGVLRAANAAVEAAKSGLEAAVAERTAELKAANEEIESFAYIVSHDLRSPLVNIMGFTSELETLKKDIFGRLATLRAGGPDAAAIQGEEAQAREFDEALAFIKGSINKMDRLINAILKLAREGRRDLQPQHIDMSQLLRSIADGLSQQATEAEATIVVEPLPSVTSDRMALEQIFSNLVDNAIKYLRPGEPGRIHITGSKTYTAVLYEIEDNGRGIDPKDRERVFDIFRRAGVQDRPGEGMGLAYVRRQVRRLGGSITLRSEPGRGSVFTVTLPNRWAPQTEREVA